jgi:A/G-specific adenine glycosylase
MLQQTQVERVIVKYKKFISAFPDFRSLAKAPLSKVLSVWQGLGYNRRVIALHKTARHIAVEFNGRLPTSVDELMKLPGVGHATASAIATFAFNKQAIFIETNIRRVFIHFFFQDKTTINDKQILPLVEKTLDGKTPRSWYFALMDYGAMLKKHTPNPNRKSAHYRKQPPFSGSNRQVRGLILKTLVNEQKATELFIIRKLNFHPDSIRNNLHQLRKEGFIQKKGRSYSITMKL